MAVGAAAALTGATSAIAGGFMGRSQAQYQAQVAKMNEQIANENARRSIDRANIEQEDFDRTSTAALLGEQEAAQSASGLSLSGKSAIRTRATARMLGRRDALNIKQAGDIEAYNYKTQAANFDAQAGAAKMSGQASLIGGFLNAANAVAGAAQTSGGWSSLISSAPASGQTFTAKPVPKPIGLVY